MSGSGDTPSSFKRLPQITPSALQFHPIARAINVQRREKIKRTDGNAIYSSNGNNIIHFDFPSETMDLRNAYLLMNIKLTATNSTYCRMAQGSWSWIDYIRVVAGNGYEDRIQFYGRLYSMLWNTTVPPDVQSTIGQDLLGIGTQATRNGWGANVNGTEYIIPVRCGLLTQGFLPLANLCTPSNGQTFFVEFVIDNPSNFIETDGSNPQITITNCRWHYEQLIGDSMTNSEGNSQDLFVASVANEIRSGGLILGYKNWATYQSPVINSSADITITAKVQSLNSILTTVVDGTVLANTTINDKYLTWPKTLGTGGSQVTYNNYQWQINNNWIPFEPIDCQGEGIRAFMHLLKYQGLWESKGLGMYFGSAVSLQAFNANQFIIVGDFFSVPRCVWDLRQQETQFNDLNMFTSNVYPLLRIELSGPPPAQTIAYNYVFYNVLVFVSTNGLLRKNA